MATFFSTSEQSRSPVTNLTLWSIGPGLAGSIVDMLVAAATEDMNIANKAAMNKFLVYLEFVNLGNTSYATQVYTDDTLPLAGANGDDFNETQAEIIANYVSAH